MNDYEHLKGLTYIEGSQDCYGLLRQYYQHNYSLQMANYARPLGWHIVGMDLISDNLNAEGFEVVDVPFNRLELGDGIVMAIARSVLANHVGVYVGNNYMLHHLFKQKSCVENLDLSWKKRTLTVVRHPQVTEKNKYRTLPTVNITELLPPHVRANYPS